MDYNDILVWLYGSVFIGSIFVIIAFGRIALKELAAEKVVCASESGRCWALMLFGKLRHNLLFIVAFVGVVQSLSLMGVGANRVGTAWAGHDIAGDWPLFLSICMLGLALAKALFNWAAYLAHPRPIIRTLWWVAFGLEGVWALIALL